MLRRLSFQTDEEIIGIAPGTRVQLVREGKDGVEVSDGIRTFKLSPDEITNDLDVVAKISESEIQRQSQIAAWQKHQMDLAMVSRQDQGQKHSGIADTYVASKRIRSLQSQHENLSREEQELVGLLEEVRKAQARRSSGPRSRSAFSEEQQRAFNEQLRRIRSEQNRIQNEISDLREF